MTEDLGSLGRQLEGFFAGRVRRGADAQDLVQETLVRALAKWGQLRQPESRRAWVFSVAHNVLRDEYRAARREPLPGDARDDRAAAETAPEWRLAIRDAVGAALRTLPAEQRHVILLRLFDDLSFAQIGRRLGVPEGTARTRAFHGLRRLRAAVAARLRQGGWLVECGIVRQRLLQIAFGLSADRAGEELRRHLAACAECRQEAEVVGAMLQGVAATAQSSVMVAGWAMHDIEGNATSYWVNEQVNFGDAPQSEWGCNVVRRRGAPP